MALANMGFKKTKVGLIWGRRTKREGEKREEEKRKKKKRRREGVEIKPSKPKVWNFGFCMDHMEL